MAFETNKWLLWERDLYKRQYGHSVGWLRQQLKNSEKEFHFRLANIRCKLNLEINYWLTLLNTHNFSFSSAIGLISKQIPVNKTLFFSFETHFFFHLLQSEDDFGILRDALCIFEVQKMHVYFPNGSDFHIQLPFKVSYE